MASEVHLVLREINRKLKGGKQLVLPIKMMQIRLFPAFILSELWLTMQTFSEGSVNYVNEIDERKKTQQTPIQNHKKRAWTAASVLCNMSSYIIFNKQVCLSKHTHALSPPPLFYDIPQNQTQAS